MNHDENIAGPSEPQPPKRIGHYEIRSLIGRGGMGEVFLAEHPMLGKRAALKVLKLDLCRIPEQVARFQQEAMAVCRIGHPAIVDVFDFGALPDGRVYYLMEYLEGQSLAEYLKAKTALSPFEAIEIIAPVAEGLEAAHGLGIVHRDIKPENIFLKEFRGKRIVKVLDFGIAKLLGNDRGVLASATKTGMILGTPLYMAPEQAAGANDKISPATDVYALAVVFYQMLTGRPPFTAESQIEVLMHHLKTPPPGLTLPQNAKLSHTLTPVLQKALAKKPADRFQTMSEFLGALRRAVQMGPTVQSPAHLPETKPQGPAPSSERSNEADSVPALEQASRDPAGSAATQPGASPAAPLPAATGPGDLAQDEDTQDSRDLAHSDTFAADELLRDEETEPGAEVRTAPVTASPVWEQTATRAVGGLPRWASLTLLVAGLTLLGIGAIVAATLISVRLIRSTDQAPPRHPARPTEVLPAGATEQDSRERNASVSPGQAPEEAPAHGKSTNGRPSAGQQGSPGENQEKTARTSPGQPEGKSSRPRAGSGHRHRRSRHITARSGDRATRTSRSAPNSLGRPNASGPATRLQGASRKSSTGMPPIKPPKKMTKTQWLVRRSRLYRAEAQAARQGRLSLAAKYSYAIYREYHNPNILLSGLNMACAAGNKALARKIWKALLQYFSANRVRAQIQTCKNKGIILK